MRLESNDDGAGWYLRGEIVISGVGGGGDPSCLYRDGQVFILAKTGQLDWLFACHQLIILDEADSMTNDAQNALRRIMEKFTENVRFCLIGNYLSKIIPALQSRFSKDWF